MKGSDESRLRAAVWLQTPLGWLRLEGGPGGVAAVEFGEAPPPDPGAGAGTACLDECRRQLDEYFRGRRQTFDLPLNPAGTPFQLRVWEALRSIPCGRTATYGEIARAVGRPAAFRAVGQANHRNPLAIVVPCHRVIGGDGRLTGYGGGLWRKQWLLDHERRLGAS